ncbi:MAG: Methionyl-tRNA formyltransferase, partial [uncultured bacterium]
MTIIFFGSFQKYSVQVLEKLTNNFSVTAVITTPPKPAGRHMELKPTEVALYARSNKLPLYELYELSTIPDIPRPDFIVVAGYGRLIPPLWLEFPKIMAVNMHPSLLPQYRGAFPAEWAILNMEKETGVTLVKMSAEFDKGDIIAQKKFVIEPSDTRETLYKKLYDMGAKLLVDTLPAKITPRPQASGDFFYARRLTRDDGFVPWEEFTKDISKLERKLRALTPWPGVWT